MDEECNRFARGRGCTTKKRETAYQELESPDRPSVNNNSQSRRGRKNSREVYVENAKTGKGGYSRTMKYYIEKFPDGK